MQKWQSLNEYTVNITVDGIQVNQTTFSKSLGLNIDGNLSWKAHIHEISKKKSPQALVWLSNSGHFFVSIHTAFKIYKGLIKPCTFDYFSAVWDGLL